jgi:hypothetical protein
MAIPVNIFRILQYGLQICAAAYKLRFSQDAGHPCDVPLFFDLLLKNLDTA